MNKIRKIRAVISDHRQRKYISYKEAIGNWYRTRNVQYKMYNISSVKEFKTSDTIFVLGNGPSLNLLNNEQINVINNHNSFGVSFSFLKSDIIPTFHLFSLEPDPHGLKLLKEKFSHYRKAYKDVVMFLNSKAFFKMAHPRTTPSFFPEEAKCCFVWHPEAIALGSQRQFDDSDFDKSFLYRGILSRVLDLISKLDYKNIVLLGVDLDRWNYFYEDIEDMAEGLKKTYEFARGVEHVKEKDKKYPSMYPKDGKSQPLDEYLCALKDYLKRKKDVDLFIGFKNNMLYPKIPAYFD
jgi:hypothetical protein